VFFSGVWKFSAKSYFHRVIEFKALPDLNFRTYYIWVDVLRGFPDFNVQEKTGTNRLLQMIDIKRAAE